MNTSTVIDLYLLTGSNFTTLIVKLENNSNTLAAKSSYTHNIYQNTLILHTCTQGSSNIMKLVKLGLEQSTLLLDSSDVQDYRRNQQKHAFGTRLLMHDVWQSTGEKELVSHPYNILLTDTFTENNRFFICKRINSKNKNPAVEILHTRKENKWSQSQEWWI